MYVKEIKRLEDGRAYAIEARNDYDNLQIHMKWDGCINLYSYSNGDTPDEHSEENVDYIHICEVKEFIKELQAIVDIAEKNFHADDFKNYWK